MKEIINGYVQNYQEFPLSVGSLAETNILRMTTVYSVGVRLSGNNQFIRFFGSEAYGVYFIAGLIYLARGLPWDGDGIMGGIVTRPDVSTRPAIITGFVIIKNP